MYLESTLRSRADDLPTAARGMFGAAKFRARNERRLGVWSHIVGC